MAGSAIETKFPEASEPHVRPRRIKAPLVSSRAPGTNWKILIAVLLGLILVPLSFAARVDTQMVLSPDFGPERFYYFTALSFNAGFHLLLGGLALTAIAQRFRNMLLNICVLEMLIGYGAASVMFAVLGG